tara:strand:- start:98 stop:688 length:591 start_codon:yes stop_codon:yes gene_type:complete
MNRELFFPTAIYIAELQDLNLNPELEKNIIAWSNRDKGLSRTNVDGWHSQTNMNKLPEYKKLVDVLYEAQRTIYEQEHLDSEPYLGNMWANINPPGGMNRAHMHPNALWSGVYYVKAHPDSGHLKVDDPRAAASMSRPRQKSGPTPSRLWRETSFEPKAGRLIMFPAWLTHCVDPNKSNDNRISVSFNFMQKCLMV